MNSFTSRLTQRVLVKLNESQNKHKDMNVGKGFVERYGIGMRKGRVRVRIIRMHYMHEKYKLFKE